jgi:hypothetical protein
MECSASDDVQDGDHAGKACIEEIKEISEGFLQAHNVNCARKWQRTPPRLLRTSFFMRVPVELTATRTSGYTC